MSPRPIIFISAVSRELRSARQLVANTLTFLGYEPEWQDIFGTEQGDLRAMLRRRVDASQGVVQLVGACYGVEPRTVDETFGRCSYTQYEALYALQRGKKVWYLFIDHQFPTDVHDPEVSEVRALQDAYRERVRTEGHVRHTLGNNTSLENSVLKLRDDLTRLRRGVKQWAVLVVVLLALCVGGLIWLLDNGDDTLKKLAETQKTAADTGRQLAETKTEVARTTAALADLRQYLETAKGGSEQKLQQDYDAALRYVAERHEMEAGALRTLLQDRARRTVADTTAPALEKLRALREAGKFIEALDFALTEANRLAAEPAATLRPRLEMLSEACSSELGLGLYAAAEPHARQAVALADREHDFATWFRAQYLLGLTLNYLRRDRDAEELFRELVALASEKLGPEHPDTLRSRKNFASTLSAQGHFAEAEKELETVLAIQSRVLGPEQADTLVTRWAAANAIFDQNRGEEAGREYRAVLEIQTRVLGTEHPNTLVSRTGVADSMADQGLRAEAEKEYRAVAEIQTRVLGAEHPKTLVTRTNWASTLYSLNREAEAEQEFRAILAIRERTLGSEHPDVLFTCYNLANCLWAQGKKPEALAFAKRTENGRRQTLGPDHPETKAAEKLRQEYEATPEGR